MTACGSISIHAPAQGATSTSVALSHVRIFQSTLPRRERLASAAESGGRGIFQSTLPRRERHIPGTWSPMLFRFQSTLPRRERLGKMDFHLWVKSFQSTLPRRERPQIRSYICIRQIISIHAPAQGATMRPCPAGVATRFQSTLPRRERPLLPD